MTPRMLHAWLHLEAQGLIDKEVVCAHAETKAKPLQRAASIANEKEHRF